MTVEWRTFNLVGWNYNTINALVSLPDSNTYQYSKALPEMLEA